MTVHRLTRRDARRIAVRAQLLDQPRPADLHEVVRHLTMVQADPTAAVAPNADVVLWSRLGPAYQPRELADALADRSLIELRSRIRPREDIALYRAAMAGWATRDGLTDWEQDQREWVDANDDCRRDILDRLADEGPLSIAELPDTTNVRWNSSGWNDDRNVRMLLDLMVQRGEVAIAGRRGRQPLWDLAERVYPDAVVPEDEARRIRRERRLRSLGIMRPTAPDFPGEPAVVEGVKGAWRVDPEQLDRPLSARTALLSPLDRLVYDRRRMAEIFEFDYTLEMYKPAAKRRWGYWAMPILHGDRLVGKLDATADRKAGVLRVDAIHQDVPFTRAMTAAVEREIRDLARWLNLVRSDRAAVR